LFAFCERGLLLCECVAALSGAVRILVSFSLLFSPTLLCVDLAGKKVSLSRSQEKWPRARPAVAQKEVLRENVKAVSKGAIRRLAGRGGVKRIAST
jgi:hypothetical protein